MLSFKSDVIQTADIHEIQKFMDKANVEVLVGFKSGEFHVPAVHEGNKEETLEAEPVENAELAKQLTFGTAIIPARPFIEEGMLSKKKELREEFNRQLDNAREGQANWNKVGTKAVAAIQEFVRGDYYRTHIPNSKKTIEIKGSDKPLIDSGNLINALTFIVEGA